MGQPQLQHVSTKARHNVLQVHLLSNIFLITQREARALYGLYVCSLMYMYVKKPFSPNRYKKGAVTRRNGDEMKTPV